MIRALAGDGKAIELARKTDGEVADVDHLLDLAEALLDDLAALDRDEARQRFFGRPKLFAEKADEIAPARRGNRSP